MLPAIYRININKLIRVFLVLALLSVISGCVSHIKELREAQNHFNSAAMLENQLKTDPLSGDALVISAQANASYHLSSKILANLIDEKEQKLRKDNLLGTAYTLKALAQWRIGQYDDAINTVGMAKSDKEIKLFPRDRALMNALSGLIKNDQAHGHMAAKDYDYDGIKRLLLSSIEDINSQIRGTDSLGLYLVIARLSVLKNWADLRGTPKAFTKDKIIPSDFDKGVEIKQWCVYAIPAWNEFRDALNNVQPDRADSISGFWGKRLGMPEACPNN
ncbi:MAG: hypothetical protein KKC46_14160 [Proteobacteria bacterium]|nr:hypothetical protein [Pseudomonadota bacterium]